MLFSAVSEETHFFPGLRKILHFASFPLLCNETLFWLNPLHPRAEQNLARAAGAIYFKPADRQTPVWDQLEMGKIWG